MKLWAKILTYRKTFTPKPSIAFATRKIASAFYSLATKLAKAYSTSAVMGIKSVQLKNSQ